MASESNPNRSASKQGPPIQARAQRTRAAILAVASDQFETLGYAETSVKTILATGKLTKGAIYFHFSSKEAIAYQLIADWNHTVRRTVEATYSLSSATDRLQTVFSELAREITADTQLRAGMKLTLEPSINNDSAFMQWVSTVSSLVENTITAGELKDIPVTQRLAWNLCAGTVGAAHAHSITPNDIALTLRIEDAVSAHLNVTRISSLEPVTPSSLTR